MTKSITGLNDLLFLILLESMMVVVLNESLHDVSMAFLTRDQKRRCVAVAFQAKNSAFFDEETDDGMMTMLTSDDERAWSLSKGVGTDFVVEEDLDDL